MSNFYKIKQIQIQVQNTEQNKTTSFINSHTAKNSENMQSPAQQQELAITGGLLSISLFQEKLMRNFYIINNRLKKLESLQDIGSKTKNIEKQLKFLTVKVDSMNQKLPKDGQSVSKKDVQTVTMDQVVDMFNNQKEKMKQTQVFTGILNDIQNLKNDLVLKRPGNRNQQGGQASSSSSSGLKGVSPTKSTTSFTAGTVLLSETHKKAAQPSKELLGQVLSKQQSKIVADILNEENQREKALETLNEQNQEQKGDQKEAVDLLEMKKDIQRLYQIINIKRSQQYFAEKYGKHYEKFQTEQEKGKRAEAKRKQKNTTEDSQEPQALMAKNLDKLFLATSGKNKQASTDSKLKSSEIHKQDILARKTFTSKNANTLLTKQQLSSVPTKEVRSKGNSELSKVNNLSENKLFSKSHRANSLKKIDRNQKKLRVDDMKDLNSVLKQIESRLQHKIQRQVFFSYALEFEQKLEILRITKDPTNELNDIRRMMQSLENKLQYVISYLQSSIANEDDALIVKKSWTCISCDKTVDKFNGKTGQHLNWDLVSTKKMSPIKAGAFGQTGQMASKIKNLMLDTNNLKTSQ